MSTPAVLGLEVAGDQPGRVGGRDVGGERGAADLAGQPLEVGGERRDVEADDVGAVAGEHSRDLGADPARGAGDERDLAGERPIPVELGTAIGGRDPDDLAGDVGGARREQEAQRRLDLVLGAGRDVDELRGGAAADLLAERADEALERALRGRLARRAAVLGRRPEDDDAAAGRDAADRRVEERARARGARSSRGSRWRRRRAP